MKTKAINYTWWICAIIGLFIGLGKADGRINGYEIMAFAGIVIGAIIGAIIGSIIDSIAKSEVASDLSNNIKANNEVKKLKKEAKSSLSEYDGFKSSFKYLSSETLLDKYHNGSQNGKMYQLALEEELVDRGLLQFSPMHEKIEKINDVFKDNSTTDEIQRTKEFIASRLGCEVKNVKTVYMNKLREMGYEFSDLQESEVGFGNKAKEEAEKLGMRIENTPSSLILKWSREFIENNK